MLADLSRGRYTLTSTVHLDPDLARNPVSRLDGWRPSLGQTGNAQSHLRDQDVSIGDVFLFYGWFREIEHRKGSWRYRRNAPNLHVLFGWLEIGDILSIVMNREQCLQRYSWIKDHPHVATPSHYTDVRNVLYIAADNSRYLPAPPAGGGRFVRYTESLRLTKADCSRSVWSLPGWFMPIDGREALSYHGNPSRWQHNGSTVTLQTVAKGQEFVLDCKQYPEAEEWIKTLIREGS